MSTDLSPTHLIRPMVYDLLASKVMSFSSQDVQSKMDLLSPDKLRCEYTRLMMGVLLFNARPARILMIGLGGGSLAKFCYRHLPTARITVVEINPHVVSYRRDFKIPDDDKRLCVRLDDGADFVAQSSETFDVIFADGFDVHGLSPTLSTTQFYRDCAARLTTNGVLAANLHRSDRKFATYVDHMQAAFATSLLHVEDHSGSNSVLFGFKEDALRNFQSAHLHRPARLDSSVWTDLLPSVAQVFLAASERLSPESSSQ